VPVAQSIFIVKTARLFISLVQQAGKAWFEDHAPSMGAALAFYSAFSIAPLLIIVLHIAALGFGLDAVRMVVIDQFRALLGASGAAAIEGMLDAAANVGSGGVGTAVGVLVLLVGATSVLVELQDDLDRIWKTPPRHEGGIVAILRTRVLSFALVLAIGFLLLVSLAVTSVLASLQPYWSDFVTVSLVAVTDFCISIIVFTALFGMLFKWLPNVSLAWKDVLVGAFTTAVLFNIGRLAIGLYLSRLATASAYAAAASLMVLLLWLYYSAQIFLFGAELTRAYTKHRASALR
jgi:membrane protein